MDRIPLLVIVLNFVLDSKFITCVPSEKLMVYINTCFTYRCEKDSDCLWKECSYGVPSCVMHSFPRENCCGCYDLLMKKPGQLSKISKTRTISRTSDYSQFKSPLTMKNTENIVESSSIINFAKNTLNITNQEKVDDNTTKSFKENVAKSNDKIDSVNDKDNFKTNVLNDNKTSTIVKMKTNTENAYRHLPSFTFIHNHHHNKLAQKEALERFLTHMGRLVF